MKHHKSRIQPSQQSAADTQPDDRRCVDCGTRGSEQIAELPRPNGPARKVYACSVHAARRRHAR